MNLAFASEWLSDLVDECSHLATSRRVLQDWSVAISKMKINLSLAEYHIESHTIYCIGGAWEQLTTEVCRRQKKKVCSKEIC